MTEPFSSEFPADETTRLELVRSARTWLASTLGQQLLQQERLLLGEELPRLIGRYLVHYGPSPEAASEAESPLFRVHLGAHLPGVDVVCEEQAWPLLDHAADAVLLQHGLDFCLSPHSLLREAARCVRPGGQLWIVGLNPWSAWGVRHWFARDALRDARCIGATRLTDWLGLLGFALEKRRFGCYCPPLSGALWQSKKARWERSLARLPLFGGGFYLLVARKIVVGLRPLPKPRRATVGTLVPIPRLNSETDRNDKMQSTPIEIFTDGACQGNPGPGGWGVLMIYPDGQKQELCGGEAATTNNRMEMLSAIRALEFLQKPANIRLSSDSQYLIRGINEWLPNWKKRGWRTASGSAVKNIDLWQALDAQLSRHRIEWRWVRGHNGHPGNERADQLARQGIGTRA